MDLYAVWTFGLAGSKDEASRRGVEGVIFVVDMGRPIVTNWDCVAYLRGMIDIVGLGYKFVLLQVRWWLRAKVSRSCSVGCVFGSHRESVYFWCSMLRIFS